MSRRRPRFPCARRRPRRRARRPPAQRRARLRARNPRVAGDRPRHRRWRHRRLGARETPREVVDVSGTSLTRGIRRPPHAPRVDQALGGRIRTCRAAARDDGGGGRSARDRQRLRRPRRGRPRRGRSVAPVHLRDLRLAAACLPHGSRARQPSSTTPPWRSCWTSTGPSESRR